MSDHPPIEYGDPRRYTVCIVCDEPIDDGVEPVCSDTCWVAVRDHLGVDALPDGLTRNEQIQHLAAAGRRLQWIGAWYGLAYGTIKNIVAGVDRPRTRSRMGRLGVGWLDRQG